MTAKKIPQILIWIICCVALGAVQGCKDEKAKERDAAISFVHSAEDYAAQGQYRSAMLAAKNAIQKAPEDPRAYKILANFYNQLGAYSSAQQLLEPIVQKSPAVAPELAFAYIENKKYRSAIKVLSSYEPEKNNLKERVVLHKLLARAYMFLDDDAQFMSEFEALRGLGATQEEWAQLRAENLLHQGRNLEAYTALDEVADNKKIGVKTLYYLATFSVSQKQFTNAESYLLRALEQLPVTDLMLAEKANVLKLLVEVLNQEGRTADAYVYQKSLSENNPDSLAAQDKFNESMILFNKGKFEESEKLLNEIREQFPQEKNTAILLGLVNFERGDLKKANELFDQFLDVETTTAPVVKVAAMAKFRVNQTEEALDLLKRGAEQQPEKPEMLAAYGLALLEQDIKSKEAEKHLLKSLELNSKQAGVALALAKHFFAINDRTQAMSQLQNAYNDQPTDFVTQLTYFHALASAGKLEQIKNEIAEFKRINPGVSRNQFLDGWYKLTTKDLVGAQVIFEKSLLNKNNLERVDTYTALTETYVQLNQKQKAADLLKEMLKQYPTNIPTYAQWLQLEQALNRPKEVINYLQNLESSSQAWQTSVVLAQVYVAQGQLPNAVKHIELSLQKNPNVDVVRKIAADLYHNYGLQLLSTNQIADAKIKILKALDYAPTNMNYLASLVQIEISEGHISEAQKVLDQFSHSNDLAAERAYLQSLIRTKENKPQEALVSLKESWAKKPLPIVAEAIFAAYETRNQRDESIKFVDDWMLKLPKTIRPYLLKALDEQANNNLSEAAELYEKSLSIDPNSLVALNNLAWVYHELKNTKAVEFATRAFQIDPNNPAVIDTYASILFDINREEEAYALFQKASLMEPKNVDIQKHLLAAKKKLRK